MDYMDIEVLEDLFLLKSLLEAADEEDNDSIDKDNKELVKHTRTPTQFTGGQNIVIEENPKLFKKFTRLTTDQFKTLLNLTGPSMRKLSRRKPISPQQRLYITLHFLGHGQSLTVLSSKFGIGLETVRSVVLETCETLWNVLSKLYMCPPNEDEWKEISNNFFDVTGLPNCLGALDGKHIHVNCPPHFQRQRKYRTRKKLKSIIVLAACDCNYCFTMVDICEFGSQNDGVFKNSDFGINLMEKSLDIPPAENLPASNILFPYYFAAASSFPLKENIMKPFARITDSNREYFNQIIFNARIRIEAAFGLLTSQWKILGASLSFSPANSRKIVLASIVLHNYIRFFKTETSDIDENIRSPLLSVDVNDLNTKNLSPQIVLSYRNQLCEYLNL